MKINTLLHADGPLGARELVDCLGAHPRRALSLDFESVDDETAGRWLVAACLLDPRVDEERALDAYRGLVEAELAEPGPLRDANPKPVLRILQGTPYPAAAAQRVAPILCRVSRTLCKRWNGSLSHLAGEAEGLEDLAARLAGLAPGFGRAAVARFLVPLRDRWDSASDLPLDPTALAAAVHVGWVAEWSDPESAVGALRAVIAESGVGPDLADLEAALTRLGRRSCSRERTGRCPLGEACPRRSV